MSMPTMTVRGGDFLGFNVISASGERYIGLLASDPQSSAVLLFTFRHASSTEILGHSSTLHASNSSLASFRSFSNRSPMTLTSDSLPTSTTRIPLLCSLGCDVLLEDGNNALCSKLRSCRATAFTRSLRGRFCVGSPYHASHTMVDWGWRR